MAHDRQILRETLLQALGVAPEERSEWARVRLRGDETLTEAFVSLTAQAEELGGLSLLESGGALRGPLFDALTEKLAQGEPIPSGTRVGRFVVLDEVGSGGMGVVFAAWDPELDRKVALKLLHAEGAASRESEDRLRREAQAMARLSHDNVITVHEVGQWQDRVFVAMEFVDGENLAAWQRSETRPWREVLEVYLHAGRGLAAAHAAGLVHRDFKPQNILLGSDRRVRVVDFGLARSIHSEPEEDTDAEAIEPGPVSPLPVLTRAGQITGTLAYMAPEQLLGRAPDPRGDQFSYCVSLYQALWGALPFPTKSPAELSDFYQRDGQPNPPPSRTALPKAIQTAVLRGLSVDPGDRWPDMDALLAAIDRGATRRFPTPSLVAALAVMLVVSWWFLASMPSTSPCDEAAARISSVWDQSVQDRLGAALRQGSEPATSLYDRTFAALDDYRTRWISARTDACEATHVRGEQSGELLDLRMACLDRRLQEFDALTQLLIGAPPEVLASAPEAALALEPLEICSDARFLRAPIRRPTDPSQLQRLEDLESDLAQIKAAVDAGQMSEVLRDAESLVIDSAALGFAPFEAEVRWTLADLVERLGEFDRAADEAFSGWAAAERGGHDEYRLRALSLLVWIDGNDRGDLDEARRWQQLAEATLERLDGGGLLEAELVNNIGAALQTSGRSEEALPYHRRALELRREILGSQSYATAKSLNNIGSTLFTTARFEEALDYYRRALETTEQALGRHAATAMIQSNIGASLTELQRSDEAVRANQLALEMRRELFGPDNVWVGFSQINLALSYLIDQPDLAEKPLDEASLVLQQALPEDHPYQAFVFSTRGAFLLATEHPDDAIPWLERSLATWEEHGIVSPYEMAGNRFGLARALWQTGDRPRAIEAARTAWDELSAAYPIETPLHQKLSSWLAERG